MDAQTGFADVNGTRLYYELAGAGPPLVLIHGFTLDARMWDDQWPAFTARHRVLRYDMRGFGRSSPPDDAPYSHAADLGALLDDLGIPQAAILGLSLGGSVAVNFALAYPARTRAFIPADATLDGWRWPPEVSDGWRQVSRAARAEGVGAGRAAWLQDPLFAPLQEQPAVAGRFRQLINDYAGWQWLNRDPARGLDPPAAQRLGEIQAPTLVVVGERETQAFREVSDTLARQIPGARQVVLPGAGHMSNMENPAGFNASVLGFLAAL